MPLTDFQPSRPPRPGARTAWLACALGTWTALGATALAAQDTPLAPASAEEQPPRGAGAGASAGETPGSRPGADEPPGDPRSRARNSEPVIAPPPLDTPPHDTWFPRTLRPLSPYLQMANRFGTHALKPGALIEADAISDAVQAIKTQLAGLGVRYSFDQTLVMTAMSDRVQGDPVIGAYSYDFFGNWTIFEGDAFGGTCGWLSGKLVGDIGIGTDLGDQNPRVNIGAVSSPNAVYHSVDLAMEELAWAQSFADGRLVVLLGLINQTNYLDINRYANSEHGQLLNASFVNSLVLPAPGNNLGVTLQWQPCDAFYAMLGAGPNNQALGANPWRDVSLDNMSYVGEIGLVASNFCGMGPGVFRVQPFLATFEGEAGGGVAFNLEQQLGAQSPFGVFSRIGFGDDVTAGIPGNVKTEASLGLALLSPFGKHPDRGLFSSPNNDYAAVAFVWNQPGDSPGLDHDDEYALELTLAIQLTPTATLQPDFQLVWDPVNNPDGGPAAVFQIQLNIAW